MKNPYFLQTSNVKTLRLTQSDNMGFFAKIQTSSESLSLLSLHPQILTQADEQFTEQLLCNHGWWRWNQVLAHEQNFPTKTIY
jgi:hypothetical protein